MVYVYEFSSPRMQFIADRNVSAHESSDSIATLMSSPPFKDTEVYFKWKDAFPVVCNMTIEEVNANAVDPNSELL